MMDLKGLTNSWTINQVTHIYRD